MRLRPMTIADSAFAAALTAGAPEASAWGERDYAGLLQSAEGAAGFGFIAELAVEGHAEVQPRGFLVGRIVADEAEILNVVVDPSARRHGAGRALVAGALQFAGSRGVRRVFLEVRAGNLPAQRLYAASGFVELARRQGYYHSPAEDAMVLQRQLG